MKPGQTETFHYTFECSAQRETKREFCEKNKRWIGWWQWKNSEKRANLLFTKDTNESIISLLLLLPLSSRCHTSLSYTLIHHLKDSRHIAYFSISPFQDSVKCVGNSNLSFFSPSLWITTERLKEPMRAAAALHNRPWVARIHCSVVHRSASPHSSCTWWRKLQASMAQSALAEAQQLAEQPQVSWRAHKRGFCVRPDSEVELLVLSALAALVLWWKSICNASLAVEHRWLEVERHLLAHPAVNGRRCSWWLRFAWAVGRRMREAMMVDLGKNIIITIDVVHQLHNNSPYGSVGAP